MDESWEILIQHHTISLKLKRLLFNEVSIFQQTGLMNQVWKTEAKGEKGQQWLEDLGHYFCNQNRSWSMHWISDHKLHYRMKNDYRKLHPHCSCQRDWHLGNTWFAQKAFVWRQSKPNKKGWLRVEEILPFAYR